MNRLDNKRLSDQNKQAEGNAHHTCIALKSYFTNSFIFKVTKLIISMTGTDITLGNHSPSR